MDAKVDDSPDTTDIGIRIRIRLIVIIIPKSLCMKLIMKFRYLKIGHINELFMQFGYEFYIIQVNNIILIFQK
jgi:hypothetical protein